MSQQTHVIRLAVDTEGCDHSTQQWERRTRLSLTLQSGITGGSDVRASYLRNKH